MSHSLSLSSYFSLVMGSLQALLFSGVWICSRFYFFLPLSHLARFWGGGEGVQLVLFLIVQKKLRSLSLRFGALQIRVDLKDKTEKSATGFRIRTVLGQQIIAILSVRLLINALF